MINLHGKRWCYYVPESQDPKTYGGFVPAVVIAYEAGYYPCTGDPAKHQAPWVWGQTLQAAQEICRAVNARRGLTEEDEFQIVGSSMGAR